MEVANRTDADKKGGHLATKRGGLLLRESAQCPEKDEAAFQDVTKHKFFNTNNLWVDLEALKAAYAKFGGALPLPVRTRAPGLSLAAAPGPHPPRCTHPPPARTR